MNYITTKQLSEALGISERTAKHWKYIQRITPAISEGHYVRWDLESVIDELKKSTLKAANKRAN